MVIIMMTRELWATKIYGLDGLWWSNCEIVLF